MLARTIRWSMQGFALAALVALAGCTTTAGGGGGFQIVTSASPTTLKTGDIVTITVTVTLQNVLNIQIDFVKQAGATGAISSQLIEVASPPGSSTWVTTMTVPPCVAGSFLVEAFAHTTGGTSGPGSTTPLLSITDTSGGNCGGDGGGPPPPPF